MLRLQSLCFCQRKVCFASYCFLVQLLQPPLAGDINLLRLQLGALKELQRLHDELVESVDTCCLDRYNTSDKSSRCAELIGEQGGEGIEQGRGNLFIEFRFRRSMIGFK